MKSLLSRCRIDSIKRRLGDLPALSQTSVCLIIMVNLDRAAASVIAPVNRVSQETILAELNLSALKGEDSQATRRITTLRLAPEGSHRPHASGFRRGLTPSQQPFMCFRLQVQLN